MPIPNKCQIFKCIRYLFWNAIRTSSVVKYNSMLADKCEVLVNQLDRSAVVKYNRCCKLQQRNVCVNDSKGFRKLGLRLICGKIFFLELRKVGFSDWKFCDEKIHNV